VFSPCPDLLFEAPSRLPSVHWHAFLPDVMKLITPLATPSVNAGAVLALYSLMVWCLVMGEIFLWVGKWMEGNGSHFYVVLLEIAAFTRKSASSLCKSISCCYSTCHRDTFPYFLCFLDRPSLYNFANKSN
jgi:hypothetical protein